MGYQPRKKFSRDSIRGYRKSLREKSKERKSPQKLRGSSIEKAQVITEREVSEVTLKRLHTLGSQKFGSSPFSDHFDRWLTNVSAVLDEFETHPNINADEQFKTECSQTLTSINSLLEDKRRKEALIDQKLKNLEYCRHSLKQISSEYATIKCKIKGQKNNDIKRLNSIINHLRKEQDKVIRMKTGFLRGISKKDREQKEAAIAEELNNKQTELELIILNFKNQQENIEDEYEKSREPVLEQIKDFKRKIRHAEIDGSLEERWFACEALIDAINDFLQRKATTKVP
jgi:hypothetical protein